MKNIKMQFERSDPATHDEAGVKAGFSVSESYQKCVTCWFPSFVRWWLLVLGSDHFHFSIPESLPLVHRPAQCCEVSPLVPPVLSESLRCDADRQRAPRIDQI